jgi:hypothetical protein
VAKRLIVDELIRLTLTQKGKATAKHPLLREGVVEVVKATPTKPTTPNAPKPRKAPTEDEIMQAYRLALHPGGEGLPANVTHKATATSPYPNLDRYRKQYH